MASKAATTAEVPEVREEAAEAPLLDTLAAAIKKMVARGKERGYVTYDELNSVLPPDEVSSEQIEDTMAMLATDADEILVGQAPQMRANPGPQEHGWVNQFNDLIAAGPPLG